MIFPLSAFQPAAVSADRRRLRRSQPREMMLEPRHAWRAVCDHLAHEFRPAVERLARQHRSELAQDEVRLGMADAAALLVKLLESRGVATAKVVVTGRNH